jgi:hypothetical protein
MSRIVDLNSFANGAVAERFNLELQKLLENIADPNTDPKKARKLVLTVKVSGNENRDIADVEVEAKLTLAPAKPIESKLVIDRDNKGKIIGAELKSGVKGQTFIDDDGDISDDKGNKIIDFRKMEVND